MDTLHAPFAALLNRGISQSTSAQALCEELEGRSLEIEVKPTQRRVRLTASGGRLEISGTTATPADAGLSAGLAGFNQLLLGDAQAAIQSGEVALSGDSAIAEKFQSLLNFARPDPEELLSRLVGDVAAHQLGQAARGAAGWAANSAESFARSLKEYLQEERHDLPTAYEVDEFLRDVDTLANDVERAAARLARLRQTA